MRSKHNRLFQLTASALLCAIGIVIPIFSPVKIILGPASFTLASHVAIFIAMFISPACAAVVALGTTFGFFIGGFPLVIVCRAATHLVFALCGALILRRKPQILDSTLSAFPFALLLSLIHAVCEVLVVLPFYFDNALSPATYQKSFYISVLLLVGVGTVIHSMVDFAISMLVWKPLRKVAGPEPRK